MTKDDLYFAIQVKKSMEFNHNGKTYHLYCDKDENNKDVIKFGILYEEETYTSFGEFYNKAKVENHFFKEFMEDL